jgi:WD40-like Beta Propeller Repeat
MTRGWIRTIGLALALTFGADASGQTFPRLEGPYLGQKPPGLKPQAFAPGIVTTDGEEGCAGFAKGGTVFLFQRFLNGRCHTYITRLKDGAWTAPELIPFWATMAENGDFVISSDDRTMLYQVRSLSAAGPISHIWRAEVTDSGWGPQASLPPPVNTPYFESYASDTADGSLYFFSRRPGGKGRFDLYRSAFKDGTYAEPINLGSLNTESDEWDPFIAPDESYVIFCSQKPGGLGRDDLYISFKEKDGRWGPPVNLGEEINSPGSENRPCVTRDGQYFFFTSTRNGSRDVYWVAAAYLDKFKK